MAYIDYTYYTETFGGTAIPAAEFPRLADVSSDTIYALCSFKPSGTILTDETFLKACAYQTEFIYEQGGLEAIFGRSDASQSGGSEHLGNYSVSGKSGKETEIKYCCGVPVSPLAVMLLNKLGLLSRWLYAYRYRGIIDGLA